MTGAGGLTVEQRQTLAKVQALVGEINRADAYIAQNNPTTIALATAQLLSVIAKALVLQLAESTKLGGRLLSFGPGSPGPA